MSRAELRAPVFTGVNYDFWCIKMKMTFKSHNLWKVVEEWYEPTEIEGEQAEKKQIAAQDLIARDARAFGLIQTAVSDEIFQRSANHETTKEAWDTLKQEYRGDSQVGMTMNISADLQSLLTWKTKQVFVFLAAEYGTRKNSLNQISLWDGILPTKEHAKFWIHTSNKYRFINQGTNLRGKDFNLTLHWHVMPKTGKMFADKIVMSGYRLPQEYR